MSSPNPLRIGLALGSGAARGLAHIGVMHELKRYGLKPDIVCGTSIGAFMGAAYAMDCVDEVEQWLLKMNTLDMVRYMDITPFSSNGLADGNALMEFAAREFGNPDIQSIAMPYAAVATEMNSGREIWLREGPIWDAARASMAMPGVLTPVQVGRQWMLDGGLVNPVPVSVCKALGADIIIAVNLNGDLVKRPRPLTSPQKPPEEKPESSLMERITTVFREKSSADTPEWISPDDEKPGLFNVISSSINIMQDRITRSRLAGEPADLVITPRLNHIGLMEFNRGEEAIKEGRMSVRRMHSVIEHRIGATLQEDPSEGLTQT